MKYKNLMVWTFIAIVFLIVINAAALIIVSWPIENLSIDTASTFSSGFGILNILFSGLAFWGLIWTIIIQINENNYQKKETKKITITQILMDEAKSCIEDMDKVIFTNTTCKIITQNNEILCWDLFYAIEGVSHAVNDGEISEEIFINDITALFMENIEKLTYLFERLDRCIDYARYLLAYDEISILEIAEIKSLFFNKFDNRIFIVSSLLSSMIAQMIKNIEKKKSLAPFHPARIITFTINSINQFKNEDVTLETIQNWKKTLKK